MENSQEQLAGFLRDSLWKQFGASIDMLKNAIQLCPEEDWETSKKLFYMAYHTLFFLDYYLSIPPDNFRSFLQSSIAASENEIAEDAIDDIMPERIFSKTELLEYLQFCREKCSQAITGLTVEKMQELWIEEPGTPRSRTFPFFEFLLYNMRHVQHHAAQLNLLLRQRLNNAPGWISRVS